MRMLEDEHWWFRGRRRIIRKLLQDLRLSENSRILEIGCGTGGNLSMLSDFGNLTAVEPEQEAADMATSRGIVPVLAGHIPNGLPKFPKPFELVALFDVIEHIQKDAECLQEAARLLDSGGRILLTVPAFQFLWSIHDEENHHQKRYRKSDITALASECNLRVDYLSYFNFWLFPPVAAVRLLRKVVPYEESWKDMQMPSLWLNTLLERTFSSERHLLGRLAFPFGVSLVALLARRD